MSPYHFSLHLSRVSEGIFSLTGELIHRVSVTEESRVGLISGYSVQVFRVQTEELPALDPGLHQAFSEFFSGREEKPYREDEIEFTDRFLFLGYQEIDPAHRGRDLSLQMIDEIRAMLGNDSTLITLGLDPLQGGQAFAGKDPRSLQEHFQRGGFSPARSGPGVMFQHQYFAAESGSSRHAI